MFRKTNKVQYASAWSDRDTRNDAAKQTLKTLRSRTRWWRVFVVLACVLSPLSLLMVLSNAALLQESHSQMLDAASSSQTEKPGAQTALQTVTVWLGSKENNPFPAGITHLQWSGATRVGSHTDTNSDGVVTDYWSHRFNFVDVASGNTMRVAQLVTVCRGVETPVGVPSLLPPVVTASSSGASGALPGYPRLEQSDTLTTVVQQWSKAYAGNDDDALTVLVGDSDTQHWYKSANLGTFNNAAINWAVWAGDGSGGSPVQGSGYGAVSVIISYVPHGGVSTSGVSTSLTVLVENPTGGTPKVVAWGADGDIRSLRPHGNAVDKSFAKNAGKSDNTAIDSVSHEGNTTDTSTVSKE